MGTEFRGCAEVVAFGLRTVTSPALAVDLLEARDLTMLVVFLSQRGGPRDPMDAESIWRRTRERLGYPTLTSHALRKTVATWLDEAGLSARAIAEYLGDAAPLLTQGVHMSRNVGSVRAALSLDRMFGYSSDLA